MGLDVVAYSGIKKVAPEEYSGIDLVSDDKWEAIYEHGWFIPSIHWDCFVNHSAGVEEVPYTAENEMSFRAGSYSGYNQWRNELAVFAGYDSAEFVWEMEHPWGKPFVELINFSDCEGIIGPDLCQKLAKDFTTHHEDAVAYSALSSDDYFIRTYTNFMDALTFVGDRGILVFC